MKASFFICFLLCVSILTIAQKPKDGTYTYSIVFEEWQGKSLNAACTVQIKGDSVKIINNGTGNLTGKKGDIIDEGILMKHTKTDKWIIGHNAKDKDAKELAAVPKDHQ